MSEKINKVLLAYSGGLDTSAIIPWLIDTYHCEVICYCANVGQEEELDHLEDRAKASGATKLIIDDLVEPLCKDYIWPLVKSGAIYERKYYLGTSIARPIVAKRLVEVAQQEHADAIAHGCTGKGNDQVRLENGIHSLDPSPGDAAPTAHPAPWVFQILYGIGTHRQRPSRCQPLQAQADRSRKAGERLTTSR